MFRPIGLLVLFALATSVPGRAQVASDTGQRVRVHFGVKKQAVGVLESLGSESLMIRDTARHRTLLIPRSDITLIERSLGKRRDFFGNFFVTFVGSMFTMGALMAVTYSPCEGGLGECLYAPESREGAFMLGLGTGALVGTPLGFFVGATRLIERWTPLTSSTTAPKGLSITPILGSHIGLMGELRFDGFGSRR